MITLYTFIALASVSALAMLWVRSILHAALCLMICLLAIAGIYIVLSAEFLAVVQVMVYAGGILLLIIFGIMVTQREQNTSRDSRITGALLAGTLTILLWIGLRSLNTGKIPAAGHPVATIGTSLMTSYAAPFEIAGLLILVSMIGAMITSSYQRRANDR